VKRSLVGTDWKPGGEYWVKLRTLVQEMLYDSFKVKDAPSRPCKNSPSSLTRRKADPWASIYLTISQTLFVSVIAS
jgi:hypothetical protein